jgi:hypothetical protein
MKCSSPGDVQTKREVIWYIGRNSSGIYNCSALHDNVAYYVPQLFKNLYAPQEYHKLESHFRRLLPIPDANSRCTAGVGYSKEKENWSAGSGRRSTSPVDNRLALSVLQIERPWSGDATLAIHNDQQVLQYILILPRVLC